MSLTCNFRQTIRHEGKPPVSIVPSVTRDKDIHQEMRYSCSVSRCWASSTCPESPKRTYCRTAFLSRPSRCRTGHTPRPLPPLEWRDRTVLRPWRNQDQSRPRSVVRDFITKELLFLYLIKTPWKYRKPNPNKIKRAHPRPYRWPYKGSGCR